MLITGNYISRDGSIWHIFIWVEHTQFETSTECAFKGTINQCFGGVASFDGCGNLIEDVVTAEIAAVFQSQRRRIRLIFRDFVIEVKIRQRHTI